MRHDNLKTVSGSQFRRVTGVKRSTFNKMVEVVTEAEKIKSIVEDVRIICLLKTEY